MQLRISDYNNAAHVLADHYADTYRHIEEVLSALPLQLKASDQDGKQGTPIFDPVGTNAEIKSALEERGIQSNFPVPPEFAFLGTDVDFASGGMLVEVQFSNYPFLLNNLLRSELFFKSQTPMPDAPMRAAVIVTKAHMFDASNSTLYYEQAENQLGALAENGVFDVPMRLIGLFAPRNEPFAAAFNEYHNPRYSRTLVKTEQRRVIARPGRTNRSRCTIEFDAGSAE